MRIRHHATRAAVVATAAVTFGLGSGLGTAHADIDTHDNHGLLNGNVFIIPLLLPFNFCGNAIAILGSADADCEGGAWAYKPW